MTFSNEFSLLGTFVIGEKTSSPLSLPTVFSFPFSLSPLHSLSRTFAVSCLSPSLAGNPKPRKQNRKVPHSVGTSRDQPFMWAQTTVTLASGGKGGGGRQTLLRCHVRFSFPLKIHSPCSVLKNYCPSLPSALRKLKAVTQAPFDQHLKSLFNEENKGFVRVSTPAGSKQLARGQRLIDPRDGACAGNLSPSNSRQAGQL